MERYFIIYKPYGTLSQFTREHPSHHVLGELFQFPKDAYPVGRLDQDSEGLLIITNDKRLNHFLLDPSFSHSRTYLVQVEGEPQAEDLKKLRTGVKIRVGKKNTPLSPHRCGSSPSLLLSLSAIRRSVSECPFRIPGWK